MQLQVMKQNNVLSKSLLLFGPFSKNWTKNGKPFSSIFSKGLKGMGVSRQISVAIWNERIDE